MQSLRCFYFFFKKFFQEHYHSVQMFRSGSDLVPNCLQRLSAVENSVKRFGSRLGPTKIWVQTVCKGYQQSKKSVKWFGSRSGPTKSVLNWIQTVCKGYQQTTKVASSTEERVKNMETVDSGG